MALTAGRSQDGPLEDVLDSLELALEAIDELQAQLDRVETDATAGTTPDDRPDLLLTEVGRLNRRVEEIAEATWQRQRTDDDRLQGALDAIERLRIRVDDADPTESIRRTLDLVSQVVARLDADDGQALTELMLEAVEGLRRRTFGEDDSVRSGLDRAVASLERLQAEIEARDPAEAIEVALEAMDDIGRRVDVRGDGIEEHIENWGDAVEQHITDEGHAIRRHVDGRSEAIERRLEAIDTTLCGLAELAAALAGAVAELAAAEPPSLPAPGPVPLDDVAIAAIADRVAGALMGRIDQAVGASADRIVGRVDASADRLLGRFESAPALPFADQHSAVFASAAAAMSRLEGRLDTEFGDVGRSVERLDRHLNELEDLVRESMDGQGSPVSAPVLPGLSPGPGNGGQSADGNGNGNGTSSSGPAGMHRPAASTADVAARVKASANGLLAGLRARGRGRAARR